MSHLLPSHPVIPGSTRFSYGLGAASILLMGFGVGYTISKFYKQNPYTKRRQLILMPNWFEAYLGNNAAKRYLIEAKYEKNPTDAPIEDYLREIVAHVTSSYKEYKHEDWNVHLIHDDEVNACALPGGNIFVNTGFLKFCKNPDEIAFVLSHEISHLEGKHIAESLSVVMPLICTVYALSIYFTGSFFLDWAMYVGCSYIIELPKSRSQEYEADKLGAFICKKSGFDPVLGVNFFERVEHAKYEFTSTHPLDKNRIENVEKESKNIIVEPNQKSVKNVCDLYQKFSILEKLKIVGKVDKEIVQRFWKITIEKTP